MKQCKEKIIRFIVWKLPPSILLWAVIRASAEATTGKWSKESPVDLTYEIIYKRISEKYNLN